LYLADFLKISSPPTLSPPSLPFSFLRFLSSSCFSSPTPLQLQFSFALLGHYSCRCGMSPRSNWFMNANIRRRWNHNEPYRGYTSCFKNGTPTRKAQQHWKKKWLRVQLSNNKRRERSHFPSDSHSMDGRNKSMVNKSFLSASREWCGPKYLPSYRSDVVYKTRRKTAVSLVQTAHSQHIPKSFSLPNLQFSTNAKRRYYHRTLC